MGDANFRYKPLWQTGTWRKRANLLRSVENVCSVFLGLQVAFGNWKLPFRVDTVRWAAVSGLLLKEQA